MKTQIMKTAILLAVGASLAACGDSSNSKSGVQSGLDAKAQEKELTGEPASPEEMANQTYRLKTDKQEFVLKKLGHLVWAKFECKAEMPLGDKTQVGLLRVGFYPQFEITTESAGQNQTVVSPTQACGIQLPDAKTPVIPTGSLAKDETQNTYNLQYGLPCAKTPIVTMSWDAAGKNPGEITCVKADGKTTKATLTECTIVPVTTDSESLPQ